MSWVPYMVGFLHSLFCLIYETYGLANNWFTWGTEVEALRERIFFGIPAMTVFFHFAFGLCLALARQICVKMFGSPKSMSLPRMFLEIAICSIVTPVMALSFDIPTYLLAMAGVARPISVSVIYALFVVGFLISLLTTKKKKTNANTQQSPDYLMFSIPLIFHVFVLYMMSQRSNQSHSATVFIWMDTLVSVACFALGCGIIGVSSAKKRL